jgi:hypothetical protein
MLKKQRHLNSSLKNIQSNGQEYAGLLIPAPKTWAHPRGGTASLQPPSTLNLKNTDFVDIMVLNVLRDLPMGRNQPLKSADD